MVCQADPKSNPSKLVTVRKQKKKKAKMENLSHQTILQYYSRHTISAIIPRNVPFATGIILDGPIKVPVCRHDYQSHVFFSIT